ncbi:DUF86 domain-containing protein [Rhizobium tumorigenes]|uniref:HepT-like ribonuclease domain-containing protein n=1 Tax=Rhizobium tumorigenes TaxID=2041385 RepID=UPI00241DBB5B|nr:HepT-like ribonuclease domain-containing protein [Rhizobium tumorigenes]WFS01516.1 DUF86 domain-containing protein [Rhizobium tumorigenes]
MARDIQFIFDDIIRMIDFIEETVAGRSREKVMMDLLTELGLQRAIEIVSEASRHIPEELKRLTPEIEWQAIRAIGNILRHEYHRIADEIIWDTIIGDVAGLRSAILKMRAQTKAA